MLAIEKQNELENRQANRIMFTNCHHEVNGQLVPISDEINDVMVFTRLSKDEMIAAIGDEIKYTDCYVVPGSDLQYYFYDPLFLGYDTEINILERLENR